MLPTLKKKKDFEGEYDKNMQLWKKKMSIFIKMMSTVQAFRGKKLISKTTNYILWVPISAVRYRSWGKGIIMKYYLN